MALRGDAALCKLCLNSKLIQQRVIVGCFASSRTSTRGTGVCATMRGVRWKQWISAAVPEQQFGVPCPPLLAREAGPTSPLAINLSYQPKLNRLESRPLSCPRPALRCRRRFHAPCWQGFCQPLPSGCLEICSVWHTDYVLHVAMQPCSALKACNSACYRHSTARLVLHCTWQERHLPHGYMLYAPQTQDRTSSGGCCVDGQARAPSPSRGGTAIAAGGHSPAEHAEPPAATGAGFALQRLSNVACAV